MIGVAGDAPARVEREQDLRSKFPYAQRQVGDHALHIQSMKLPVGIVQHKPMRDFQYLAGVGKFLAAHRD